MGRIEQSDVAVNDVYGLVRASLEKFNVELKESNALLIKEAKAVKKLNTEIDKLSQKGIDGLIKNRKKLDTLTTKAIKNDKKSVEGAKLNEKAIKQQAAAEKRATIEKNKAVRASIKKRKSTIAEADSSKRLNVQLRNSRNRLKRLTIEYGKNNAITKRAARNYDRLERKQRELNATTRRGTKALKLFGLSFNTVRGSALRMAAGLGLAAGGFAIFRSAFNTVKDFEQGQADLASVLGVNVDQMKALTDQAKELGATTTFTATEVAGLQKEFAKLGFTQKEIENVTEATLLLAEATGTDLAEAASVTGSTLRAFGLSSKDTQRVVDVMAKSFSASSLDMQKFKVAMATVAPVAKAMGLSIEETTALIGTMTDSGVEASTAGAGLRNMMLDAKNAGLTLDEALIKIDKSSDKVGTSFELFGKRGATLGVILAENRDATDRLTDSLEDADGAAKKMAETQRATLGGALKLLSSAWDGYILKVNESTSASGGLRDMVVFLSENLETIVNTLITVVKVLLVYKVRLIALSIAQKLFNDGSGKMSFKLKTVTKNLKESAKAGKGLGSSLKGIGWAAAITGAIALASAFFSIVTGAAAAKAAMEEIERIAGRGEEARKTFNRDFANELKNRKELMDSAIAAAAGDAEQIKAARDEFERFLLATNQLGRTRVSVIESTISTKESQLVAKRTELRDKKAAGRKTERTKIEIAEIEELIKNLQSEKELRIEAISALNGEADARKNAGNATGGQTEAIEEQNSLLREITDERLKQIKDAEEREVLQAREAAARTIEDLKGDAEEVATLTKLIEKSLAIEVAAIRKEFRDEEAEALKEARAAAEAQRLQDLADEKAQLLQSRQDTLNEFKLLLLESNKDEAEINKEFLEFEIKQLQLRTDLTIEELITLEQKKRQLKNIELAEEKKHQEELLALRKKVFDKLDEFAQKALDKQIENSQKKQELLEKEISNSQTLEDRLRDSAANQNAVATESLAAQESITEQKEREKIREAQKEELLLEKKALWESFTAFLSQGDGILQATGKSVTGVTGFKAIVQSLTGFKKGTKGKLGDEHTAQMSGVDGHIIRADKDEMIFSGDKVARAAAANLHTTDDIVNSAIMNQQLVGVPMANHIDDRVVMTSNNSAMESKLDTLIAATKKNKPIMESPILRQGKIDGIVYAQEMDGKQTRKWMYRS